VTCPPIRAAARALAERDERAHAALVARAPRLDPLADPDFLLRELLVEERPVALLLFERGRLLGEELRVVPGPRGEHAAVELHDARREAREQRAIVSHEEDRAAELEQLRLEPLDHLDV